MSGLYTSLGNLILRANGPLKEVRLLEIPKHFVFVFADGTEFEPTSKSKREEWYLRHREFILKEWIPNLGDAVRGDPLDSIGFGLPYDSSHNLVNLLMALGFTYHTSEIITRRSESFSFPVVLRPDGSVFSIKGDLIDFEAEETRRGRLIQRRRDRKHCEMCGRPLSISDKLRRLVRHRECVSFLDGPV